LDAKPPGVGCFYSNPVSLILGKNTAGQRWRCRIKGTGTGGLATSACRLSRWLKGESWTKNVWRGPALSEVEGTLARECLAARSQP